MKALCWMGIEKLSVEDVPDPKILNPRDAIVRITRTCICGSDLHLYDGYMPTLEQGDILGHEFMGEVVEVGPGIDRAKLKVGDAEITSQFRAVGAVMYQFLKGRNRSSEIAASFGFHRVLRKRFIVLLPWRRRQQNGTEPHREQQPLHQSFHAIRLPICRSHQNTFPAT